jgi:hypothetical protein
MLAELGEVASMIWIDRPGDALAALTQFVAGPADPRSQLAKRGEAARAYGLQRETWATVTARFRAVLRGPG